MVIPFEQRIERIKAMNPHDDATEGVLNYRGRLLNLAEKELLAIVRNKWTSVADKSEAICQILENCRVKSYHA